MEAKRAIMLGGTTPPPEVEEEWNQWYNQIHVPGVLASGARKSTRYRRLDNLMKEAEKYPKYLVIYEFANAGDAKAWENSPQHADSLAKGLEKFKQTGTELKWRVYYEPISHWSWGNYSDGSKKPLKEPETPVIEVVGAESPQKDEAGWNQWYNDVHVPGVLKLGARRATRYRRLDITADAASYPRYGAIYEFESVPAAQKFVTQPDRWAWIDDGMQKYKSVGTSLRWLALYEPIKAWPWKK